MGEEELKKELKALQQKRERDTNIKKLKKQIRLEKFGQTRGGKVFNAVGDTGLKVAKKLFTPNPNPQKVSKKKKVPSIQEVMRRLPQ